MVDTRNETCPQRIALKAHATLLLVSACISFASLTHAQSAQDLSKIEIRTSRITEHFYALSDSDEAGGAIGVLATPDGVLMVDTHLAPMAPQIEAVVKTLSPQPIRYVINTHVHSDQTGGNEYFGRVGATIVARVQVRERLMTSRTMANGQPRNPTAAIGLPKIVYNDSLTLHFGGEEIRLIAVPRAHTDSDALIYFPGLDIVMAGDLLRPIPYPSINLPTGGTLQGLIDGLGVLIGLAGPNTRIIPSHGPIVGRQSAMEQRDLVLTVRDRVAALIAQGKSEEEVVAAKVTADLDAREPHHTTAERFVRDVYSELDAAR